MWVPEYLGTWVRPNLHVYRDFQLRVQLKGLLGTCSIRSMGTYFPASLGIRVLEHVKCGTPFSSAPKETYRVVLSSRVLKTKELELIPLFYIFRAKCMEVNGNFAILRYF